MNFTHRACTTHMLNTHTYVWPSIFTKSSSRCTPLLTRLSPVLPTHTLCMYTILLTHIHTHTHVPHCIHTYIRTYVRTYIRTYIHVAMHNFRRSIVLTRSRLQEWFMSLSPSCSAGESTKGPCSPVSFPVPIPIPSSHLYIKSGNWTTCSRDVAMQISILSHSKTISNFGRETNTHIVVEMGLSSLYQCVACQGVSLTPRPLPCTSSFWLSMVCSMKGYVVVR